MRWSGTLHGGGMFIFAFVKRVEGHLMGFRNEAELKAEKGSHILETNLKVLERKGTVVRISGGRISVSGKEAVSVTAS